MTQVFANLLVLSLVLTVLPWAVSSRDLYVSLNNPSGQDCLTNSTRCNIVELPTIIGNGDVVHLLAETYPSVVNVQFPPLENVAIQGEGGVAVIKGLGTANGAIFLFQSVSNLVLQDLDFQSQDVLLRFTGVDATATTVQGLTLSRVKFSSARVPVLFNNVEASQLAFDHLEFNNLASDQASAAPIFFDTTNVSGLVYTDSSINNVNYTNCSNGTSEYINCTGVISQWCAFNILHTGITASSWHLQGISVNNATTGMFSHVQFLNPRYQDDLISDLTFEDISIQNSGPAVSGTQCATLINSLSGINGLAFRRVHLSPFPADHKCTFAGPFGLYSRITNMVIDESVFDEPFGNSAALYFHGHFDGFVFKNNKVIVQSGFQSSEANGAPVVALATLRNALFEDLTFEIRTSAQINIWSSQLLTFGCPSFPDYNASVPFHFDNITWRNITINYTANFTDNTLLFLTGSVISNVTVDTLAIKVPAGLPPAFFTVIYVQKRYPSPLFPPVAAWLDMAVIRNFDHHATNPAAFNLRLLDVEDVAPTKDVLFENINLSSTGGLGYADYIQGHTGYLTYRNVNFVNAGISAKFIIDGSCTFENTNFRAISATSALLIYTRAVTLRNVTVEDVGGNLMQLTGGLHGGGTTVLVDTKLINVRGGTPNTAMSIQFMHLEVSNCLFANNTAAIVLATSIDSNYMFSIRDSVFTNNQNSDGAITSGYQKSVTLQSSSFISNGRIFSALGADLATDTILIEDCLFDSNTQPIIRSYQPDYIIVRSSRFINNALVMEVSPARRAQNFSCYDSFFLDNNLAAVSTPLLSFVDSTTVEMNNVTIKSSGTQRQGSIDVSLRANGSISGIHVQNGLQIYQNFLQFDGKLEAGELRLDSFPGEIFDFPATSSVAFDRISASSTDGNRTQISVSGRFKSFGGLAWGPPVDWEVVGVELSLTATSTLVFDLHHRNPLTPVNSSVWIAGGVEVDFSDLEDFPTEPRSSYLVAHRPDGSTLALNSTTANAAKSSLVMARWPLFGFELSANDSFVTLGRTILPPPPVSAPISEELPPVSEPVAEEPPVDDGALSAEVIGLSVGLAVLAAAVIVFAILALVFRKRLAHKPGH